MKLAIITPGFKPVPAVRGGAVEQLIQYFIEGNELNHTYDIDLYTIDDPDIRSIKYKFTRIIAAPVKPKKLYRPFYRVFNKTRNILSQLTNKNRIYNYYNDYLKKNFKVNYYDAVLVENIMDNYFTIVKQKKNEKMFFHLHNQLENNTHSMITYEKAKKILENVDSFIVVSEFLKRQVGKLGNSRKIEVVPNAVLAKKLKHLPNTEKRKLRRKYGFKETDIIFSYIGTLSKAKGFNKFLKLANDLQNETDIKFLVAGDEKTSDIKNIDKKKKLKNVVFAGYIDNENIRKIYSITDCLIIPTQIEETFGVVALEAMTMGVPIIASKSGGLPEVLSRKCAIFISKGATFDSDLKKAVVKCAKSQKLRDEMKQSAINRSKLFPRNQEEYFELMSKIILSRGNK